MIMVAEISVILVFTTSMAITIALNKAEVVMNVIIETIIVVVAIDFWAIALIISLLLRAI